MIRGVNLCEVRKTTAGLVVELSTVDDDSANRCAVSADELGSGVRDDVSTMRKWSAEIWGCERVVDYEWNPSCVSNLRDTLEVEDVALGVTDRLAIEGASVGANSCLPSFKVIWVLNEGDLDTHLWECVVELVISTSVERGTRDDVSTILSKVEERNGLCGLARCSGECTDSTLKRSNTLLEGVLSWVHDAGVDIPQLAEPEEGSSMICIAKYVGGCLVDRNRASTCGWIRCGTCVNLLSLKSPVGHGVLLFVWVVWFVCVRGFLESFLPSKGPITVRGNSRPVKSDLGSVPKNLP